MKIAIATDGGVVAHHFGRCPEYTLAEINAGTIAEREVIQNPGHRPGYLPKFLSDLGVDCIVAGGLGPRAEDLFREQNIKTIVGVSGSIDDALEKLAKGELESGDSMCEHLG